MAFTKEVSHSRRVILIHLTAVCLDKEFLSHVSTVYLFIYAAIAGSRLYIRGASGANKLVFSDDAPIEHE